MWSLGVIGASLLSCALIFIYINYSSTGEGTEALYPRSETPGYYHLFQYGIALIIFNTALVGFNVLSLIKSERLWKIIPFIGIVVCAFVGYVYLIYVFTG